MEATGPQPIDLFPVLLAAWLGGFLTKSDLARVKADEVAAAASAGYITTSTGPDVYGRLWVITTKGLTIIENLNQETL